MPNDDDLIRRGDALAAIQLGDTVTKLQARIRAIPYVDADPACTCCGGTGITYQTEGRCACQGPDLTDPVTVHVNMLRGTIAKPTVEQIIHLYGVDALTAALPARGVTVKPLVWSQNSGGVWEAQTAFGTRYSVADSQWTYGPTMVWFWVDGGDEAAQAAAQADYEARGRAMWEPQPAPDAAVVDVHEEHEAWAVYCPNWGEPVPLLSTIRETRAEAIKAATVTYERGASLYSGYSEVHVPPIIGRWERLEAHGFAVRKISIAAIAALITEKPHDRA